MADNDLLRLSGPGKRVFPGISKFASQIANPLSIPGSIAYLGGLGALGRSQGRPERWPTGISKAVRFADEMLPGFEQATYEGDYGRLPSGAAELASLLYFVDPIIRPAFNTVVRGGSRLAPTTKDIFNLGRPMGDRQGPAKYNLTKRATAAKRLPGALRYLGKEIVSRPGDVARGVGKTAAGVGKYMAKALASRALAGAGMLIPTDNMDPLEDAKTFESLVRPAEERIANRKADLLNLDVSQKIGLLSGIGPSNKAARHAAKMYRAMSSRDPFKKPHMTYDNALRERDEAEYLSARRNQEMKLARYEIASKLFHNLTNPNKLVIPPHGDPVASNNPNPVLR